MTDSKLWQLGTSSLLLGGNLSWIELPFRELYRLLNFLTILAGFPLLELLLAALLVRGGLLKFSFEQRLLLFLTRLWPRAGPFIEILRRF